MRTLTRYGFIAMMLVLLLAVESAQAAPPRDDPGGGLVVSDVAAKISYQGRVTDASGTPIAGPLTLVFQLWTDATAGNQVGSDIVRSGVTPVDGVFTVDLDVPSTAFIGQALWLRIQVNGQWLTPRQELLPVPYALGLRPGAIVAGNSSDPAITLGNAGSGAAMRAAGNILGVQAIGQTGVEATGNAVGVAATGLTAIWGDGGIGVRGTGSAGDGVFGLSQGGAGTAGVHGASSGLGYGGYFTSTNAVAVMADNWSGPVAAAKDGASVNLPTGSGGAAGVLGRSATAAGVVGLSTGGSGVVASSTNNVGVYSTAGNVPMVLITGPQAMVAYGEGSGVIAWGGEYGVTAEGGLAGVKASNTGSGPAVDAQAAAGAGVTARSVKGPGVVGSHMGTGNYAELGLSDLGAHAVAFSGTGLYAQAPNGDGVDGTTDAANKSGIYGHSSAGFGVTGRSASNNGVQGFGLSGVYGESGVDYGQGVYGKGTGYMAEGVIGVSTNGGPGLYGMAHGTGTMATGVESHSDNSYAVYGGTSVSNGIGIYTPNRLYAGGGCVGCSLSLVAVNGGPAPLRPGDVVALSGIAAPLSSQTRQPVVKVRWADSSDPQAFGVVEGRYAFEVVAAKDRSIESARITTEDAKPGDTLTVVYRGLAQMRVDSAAGALTVGDAVGAAAGQAAFARALEPVTQGSDLVWCLILGR
ncbi:MAG: hypothetical protein U0822_16595 [Anaerolineae bacterium]